MRSACESYCKQSTNFFAALDDSGDEDSTPAAKAPVVKVAPSAHKKKVAPKQQAVVEPSTIDERYVLEN
jgi:hypothetical protein